MGRPPLADRELILRAALEIGFAGLTMTAVGERLGVSHSTLYNYFRNRGELTMAAVDSIDWPEPRETTGGSS
jgi:AcrR family transcriptional regulator